MVAFFKSGGANNDRFLRGNAGRKVRLHCMWAGKIDEDIGCRHQRAEIIALVDAARDCLARFVDGRDQGIAHPPLASDDTDFCHSCVPLNLLLHGRDDRYSQHRNPDRCRR